MAIHLSPATDYAINGCMDQGTLSATVRFGPGKNEAVFDNPASLMMFCEEDFSGVADRYRRLKG